MCLLFEARDFGKRFARRASLLQAKRLYRRRSALDVNYYPVDTSQLENLAGQTMASFLLLVGPECNGVSIPVIPARLFLDLVERGQPSTQIAPADASRLGKGIGAWLVEDVIGLWTGDWMAAIVNRAEGGKDREPFLLVEMVVPARSDQSPTKPQRGRGVFELDDQRGASIAGIASSIMDRGFQGGV